MSQRSTHSGKIVSIPVNIAQSLVMFFAALKVLYKVIANTKARCRFNTPDTDRADMKGWR